MQTMMMSIRSGEDSRRRCVGHRCIFWLIVALMNIVYTEQYCYQLKMLSFITSETPDYRFVMHLHNNQTLSSVTRVLKDVVTPMWRLVLIQHNNKKKANGKMEPPKVLYNATYKVCEFWRYVKRIRIFNNVAHLLFAPKNNSGNMTLDCPMTAGTYVMRNIHVPPDTGILKFMYWPNTMYTLYGTVYSLNRDKTMEKKCHYEINGTVLKSC